MDHPLLARRCKRTDYLTQEEQLAVALSYLAKGSNFSHVGSIWGCSVTTVSRCVANVTRAVWDRLSHHISLPQTEEEWQASVLEFEHISGLPQIVGALDGSHIRIDQPINVGHAYYNHKGFQSFVAQGLVNARGKFMDVYAGHPGRTHDALVFLHSPLARQLSDAGSHLAQSLARGVHVIAGVEVPRVIVADSAYATRQFVVSSFKSGIARANAGRARFNT
ncbi:transposase family protein, partial [Bosea sp. (in: a-proteobacteria)]|uniref:transposase family protein n=1 Tax=Bosea sp. (in: a-proteobacteria) TaxID=1871050 RepID=UPI004033E7DC